MPDGRSPGPGDARTAHHRPPELRIVEVHDDETATDLGRTLIDGYPAPMLRRSNRYGSSDAARSPALNARQIPNFALRTISTPASAPSKVTTAAPLRPER